MSDSKAPWWLWAGLAGGGLWLLVKSQESSGSASGGLPKIVPTSDNTTEAPDAPQMALFPTTQPDVQPADLPTGSSQVSVPVVFTENDPNYSGTFPNALRAREDYILSKIKVGDYYANWAPITASFNGHTATFWVMADALKVDGIRVIATPVLAQQIADLMGASLLTPRLADMIFAQSQFRLKPMTRTISSETPVMIIHSQDLDDAIKKVGGKKGDLVSNVGKHWVIDNRLLNRPGRAMNYGWHFFGPNIYGSGPISEYMAVSVIPDGKGGIAHVVQAPGTRHDLGHTDYSQNVVLVNKKAILDGQVVPLSKILQDPELAPLASHQGPLKILRQPGVPELPAVPGPGPVIV